MGLHNSVGIEHCSTNAEDMGLNPVEALKIYFWAKIYNCLEIAFTTAMITSQFHLSSRSSN